MSSPNQSASAFKIFTTIFIGAFLIVMNHAWTSVITGRKASLCNANCIASLPVRKTAIVLGMARLPGIAKSPMEDRADLAAELYRAKRVENFLLSGGKGAPGIDPEAISLRKMLEARGVPDNVISIEDQSRSTIENIQNSLQILQKNREGIDSVYIVTHSYHAYRAGAIAEKYGLNARVIGAEPHEIQQFWLMPALRETFAVIWFWIRY